MKSRVYVALLHYPVYNKLGKVVATSITTFDIHDIARACKTYGVVKFFVINPYKIQREFAKSILDYWLDGYGSTYNANRKLALTIVRIVDTLETAKRNIVVASGRPPRIVVTSAKSSHRSVNFSHMRNVLQGSCSSFLFVLGTGWGVEERMKAKADYVLEPITGITDFNHLSVRSAAAIILDRLLVETKGEI